MKLTQYMLLIAALLFSGCNLITDYKLDTDPNYLKEMSLIEYLEEGKESSLTMYLKQLNMPVWKNKSLPETEHALFRPTMP